MLKKIGYRFVLDEIRHVATAHAGNNIVLSMDWENKGNAPTYGNYVLGVQIKNSQGTVVATYATATQAKNWLPGSFAVDQTISLPQNMPSGNYTIAISIVDPVSKLPKIQLANSGKDNAGWYPLTTLVIN